MYVGGLHKRDERDVVIHAPPAVLHVPSNVRDYGRPTGELTDQEMISMLRRALNDATGEVDTLRRATRLFASMLEMLVLMNRRGEWPATVDDDGTLLIPMLPLQLMQEWGGSVRVEQTDDGYLIRFRDRIYNPVVSTETVSIGD